MQFKKKDLSVPVKVLQEKGKKHGGSNFMRRERKRGFERISKR